MSLDDVMRELVAATREDRRMGDLSIAAQSVFAVLLASTAMFAVAVLVVLVTR